MRKCIHQILSIIVILIFSGCTKTETIKLPIRTVIVYMLADNNLDYFSVKDKMKWKLADKISMVI